MGPVEEITLVVCVGDTGGGGGSGDGCNVVSTLVGVFVLSVMWSELLVTSGYECQRVECAFISPVRTECGMFVMCCMMCCISVSAVL